MTYVLPRTVVGLALWLLIFAIGAGASGVVFFIAYERRLTELDARITSVRTEFEQRLDAAVAQLQQADRANQVTGTAGLLGQANRLVGAVGPSVVTVPPPRGLRLFAVQSRPSWRTTWPVLRSASSRVLQPAISVSSSSFVCASNFAWFP